jgi:crotonobetainyl-CoA:carnitine CoA-transferase CaiB-like acyl-CoA transferase
VSTFYGEQMIDYVWNGRLPERIGNRDRRHAPHGCYRALGDDSWIVIAVTDDAEWRALCEVLGRDDWSGRGDLAGADGRRERQDELDAGIEEWTSARENGAAAALLQEAGVPAAPVLSGADLFRDDHLRARGFVQELDREWIGTREYTGMWAAFSETPGTLRSPAPLLGEHNREVLGGLLGLDDDELAGLEAETVIGTVPLADG